MDRIGEVAKEKQQAHQGRGIILGLQGCANTAPSAAGGADPSTDHLFLMGSPFVKTWCRM